MWFKLVIFLKPPKSFQNKNFSFTKNQCWQSNPLIFFTMKNYEIGEENFSPNSLCEPLANYCRTSNETLFQMSLPLGKSLNMQLEQSDVRVVELFAGVGGFRLGLERASNRFKTIWANQWEPSTKRQDAFICYEDRFGLNAHCSNEDINTIPATEIPPCDLLVGGFPCQDYSVATTLKHSGGIQGRKGVLWWEVHRILRDSKVKPKYLFLENVDRLLKSPAKQRGRDFAIILASLSDLGYAVEWRVINAADYGMPQRRRRIYIVAYHESTEIFKKLSFSTEEQIQRWLTEEGVVGRAFPCLLKKTIWKPRLRIEGSLSHITENFNLQQKLSPFQAAGFMQNRVIHTSDVNAVYTGINVTLGSLLVPEEMVPEEFFIPKEELSKWAYLKGGKKEKRINKKTGFVYNYSEGSMAFPDYLDRPSRTIITGEGGSGPSRFKHVVQTKSGRYRRLLPVELERLNMFPDGHTQKASATRRAFLMGNALVTGVIEKIGRSLIARI